MLKISFTALQSFNIENYLFSSALQFLLGLFGTLESHMLGSLYIWDIFCLPDVGLVMIFSYLLIVILSYQECPLP